MVGILVHGNNHYILSGPRPQEAEARALVRYWSVVQIGEVKSRKFAQWDFAGSGGIVARTGATRR
jgi:hypothetical protein